MRRALNMKSEESKRLAPVNILNEPNHIDFDCKEEYTNVLDSFIIELNALIYVLQKECGFQLRIFMFSYEKGPIDINPRNTNKIKYLFRSFNKSFDREIFILLHLPHESTLKVAHTYAIKKEIDYCQIDPFLN